MNILNKEAKAIKSTQIEQLDIEITTFRMKIHWMRSVTDVHIAEENISELEDMAIETKMKPKKD